MPPPVSADATAQRVLDTMAEVLAKHLKPELAKAILQDAYMGAKVTALLKSASLIVPTRQNVRVSVHTHEDALRELAER